MDDEIAKAKLEKENAAVELVRARIDALYDQVEGVAENQHKHSALVDEFWKRHHNHPNPHLAWRDYYESLNEDEKHRLWEEYHISIGSTSGVPSSQTSYRPQSTMFVGHNKSEEVRSRRIRKRVKSRTSTAIKRRKLSKTQKSKPSTSKTFFRSHIWPIVSSALIVSLVWLIFNNELIVAKVKQYVSPGNSELTPIIIDPTVTVSKENKVIIPKINVDVPVVYDVQSYSESAIQAALERGVVHYGTTPLPGERGNNVIVGHSSNNFFNGGKYKFAFVLLSRLEIGDTFILHYNKTRYVYKVTTKEIVDPADFSYIQPTSKPVTTLITCDPPGTSWRRLIIQGEQISPNPDDAKAVSQKTIDVDDKEIVPGNAPSLWENVWNWLF